MAASGAAAEDVSASSLTPRDLTLPGRAFINSQPVDIVAEIQEIDRQYHRQTVGPAASEVLEKGHRNLNQLGDSLKRVSGPPSEVWVIGQGPDRVKLSRQPPEKNPEAAESYVVWKQEEGNQWERVREQRRPKPSSLD